MDEGGQVAWIMNFYFARTDERNLPRPDVHVDISIGLVTTAVEDRSVELAPNPAFVRSKLYPPSGPPPRLRGRYPPLEGDRGPSIPFTTCAAFLINGLQNNGDRTRLDNAGRGVSGGIGG